MKLAVFIAVLLLISIVGAFIFLGVKSKSGSPPGLVSEKLSHCSKRPNCICSEFPEDEDHYASPISTQEISAQNLADAIKSTISEMQGTIRNIENNYISATFTSNTFKFIDDFEIRIDDENKRLHIRSSSRVGYSDRGVNRKRVDTFRQLLLKH